MRNGTRRQTLQQVDTRLFEPRSRASLATAWDTRRLCFYFVLWNFFSHIDSNSCELECNSVGRALAQHTPRVQSQQCINLGMMAHTCNHGTLMRQTGGSSAASSEGPGCDYRHSQGWHPVTGTVSPTGGGHKVGLMYPFDWTLLLSYSLRKFMEPESFPQLMLSLSLPNYLRYVNSLISNFTGINITHVVT